MDLIVKYGGGDHEFGLKIDTPDLPPRGEVFEQMSRPVAGVHRLAKRFPKETVAKALSNEPLEDYPRAVYASKRPCDTGGESKDRVEQSYSEATEDFLRRTFHSLTFIPGISFDVRNVSLKDERQSVDKVRARYLAANMSGQLESLEEAYDGLCALRTVFQSAILRNCFSLEIVVPSRYLPELLVAAPVWFIEPKRRPNRKYIGAQSDIVRYFCDLSATDQFAYLFQMYNRIPRYLDEFTGRDVMPLPIAELVSQVRNLFDFLVIATPYHDIADQEWRDTRWTRNIDPFLFGFLKYVPDLMFFLGRWSQTGLFPLMGEMIADTMEHIRKNKMFLSNFGHTDWYRADGKIDGNLYKVFGPFLRPTENYQASSSPVQLYGRELEEWEKANHSLIKFADKLLQQYEQGNFFSFLRGESISPQPLSSQPLSSQKLDIRERARN